MKIFSIGFNCFFKVFKTADKPTVRSFESSFGVYINKTGIVYQGKQQITKFIFCPVLVVAIIEFVFKFGNFFLKSLTPGLHRPSRIAIRAPYPESGRLSP